VKVLLKEKNIKIIACIIFTIYIIMLLRLAVFRNNFLSYGMFTHGELNLAPGVLYVKLLRAHEYLFVIFQFGGNLAWFIPFGFLLPYLTGWPKALKRVLLCGFLLSFIIELSQFVFGTGVSELDDVILNTAGTFIGFQMFNLCTRITTKRNY